MSQFDETLDYINKIQRATTVEQLCAELLSVTSKFRLRVMPGKSTADPNTPSDEQEQRALLRDWPQGWLERYVETNRVRPTPSGRERAPEQDPGEWGEAETMAEPDAGDPEVIGDIEEPKSKNGNTFPLPMPDGTPVMVALGESDIENAPENLSVISLVATYAVGRALQLYAAENAAAEHGLLTGREAECLRWAAVGKSEWEISQILGISEHTSEKHLLNAKTKLGAVNRVQAVAEAIRLGYIN